MTNLKEKIIQSQSSHWYYPDGTPAYEVMGKSGKMVKTNVTHARELGLLPSVTTVLKLLNKEAINTWRVTEMFRASQEIKRLENESENDYLERLVAEAEKKSSEAKSRGDAIHKFCEYLCGGPRHLSADTLSEALKSSISDFISQHIQNPYPEKKCVNGAYNYAGTVDLICDFDGKRAIVDWKNQGTINDNGKEKDIIFYDEWIYQGAAYCMSEGIDNFISVVISRDTGKIETKIWTHKELETGKIIFLSLLKVFRLKNKLEEL